MTAQQTSQTPEADRPELSSALHSAAEQAVTPPVDLDRLVGRVRRKRRTRAGLVGGLALAVLATGGVAVPRLLAATPDPADHGHHQQQKPTARDVDANRMIASLEGLLPHAAKASGAYAWGLSGRPTPGAPSTGGASAQVHLVYDDGHGPAWIELTVERWDTPGSGGMPTACVDNQFEQCRATNLPQGARVRVLQSSDGNPANPSRYWTAMLDLPWGGEVVASESNKADFYGGAPTRHDPPLTMAQLQALVTAPVWQPIVAAVPKPAKGTLAKPSVPGVLAALLPAGFSRTPIARADDVTMGVATVLTDRRGMGIVFAAVEGDGDSTADALRMFRGAYPHAVELPDGDWLATVQKPGKGGPGTVQNWAVYLHGVLQVRIVALNSAGPTGPRSRPEPVLTLDQCAAIARSTQWREMS
ncbi:hypothetical protein [Streptacidiphilus melanogenes]|uniref:hypothetical protein n=1 Tax=Streptacidiphilus melanogenes TaxID=411235 RepID=UPI0005A82F33|nr:hypothetical protein [Streptacidiphilus melanogenes]